MGLVAELRDAEGITPVDIADLEEDLRQGRLSGAFLLRYAPWTGEEFKRLRDIPQLKEALDSPNACFAQNLRSPRFPWASTVLTAAVLLTGLLNLWLIFRGWKVNAFEARVLAVYQGGLTGFESTLLNGLGRRGCGEGSRLRLPRPLTIERAPPRLLNTRVGRASRTGAW